jgi:hypothetical protein
VGLAEDKDGGIGSLAYFSVKRAAAESAAAESGLGNQDPRMEEKNFSLRMPQGARLPATEATRQMHGAAHVRPACLRRGGKVEHATALVREAARAR